MSLKNLKIGPKLMAIMALLVLPLGLLTFLFVTESMEEIEFTRKQQDGAMYRASVFDALYAVALAKADGRTPPQAHLGQGFKDINQLGAQYDADMGTASASAAFRAALAAISFPNAAVTDVDTAVKVMETGADLVKAIADGSNITLDPEMDTYYLFETMTSEVPGTIEHLMSIPAIARVDRDLVKISSEKFADFVMERSHYEDHIGDIASNIATALAATDDAQLRGAIEAAVQAASVQLEAFKAQVMVYEGVLLDDTKRASHDLSGMTMASDKAVAAVRTMGTAIATENRRLLQARIDQVSADLWMKLAIAVIASVIAFGLMIWVVRQLSRSVGALTKTVESIAKDELDVTVPGTDRGDELGVMAKAVEVLRQNAIVARNAANENLRIKVALDNASTNMMVADTEGRIVYLNNAINGMMKQAESDLRKDLPNLVADKLVGTSMDVFHKNPAHQRTMLERLTSTHRATVNVGGRIFNLTANPVMSSDGKRLGSVVEWDEVTLERRVEVEVDKVVTAAANGNFRERLSVEDKVGFMRNLAVSMNKLCETTASALDDVNNSLSSLANGDLTARITRDYDGMFDELKANLNQTAERLGQIVSEVVVGAGEVTSAASEITAGTNDLSSRTEQQASNLQETAASMEEIASTIKQNADNAQQANQLAINARTIAAEGGQVADKAVTAMSRIEASSQKMSDIIGVIDEIAFQTNLLALNAAVEAARAGDAGKGFAVVASEVRSLAQRSSEAAKEIKTLIQESDGQVKDGVRLVNEAGKSLGEIVGSVKKVTDIVSEIAAASREQATGVEEINKAVSQMDEMTQQNSALVEENAAACRMLQSQAENMTQRMAFFTLEQQAARPMARASAGGSRPAAPATKAPMAKAPMAKAPARPAAPAGRQVAPPARKMGGGTAAQLQADLHSAFDDDPDWKEF